MTTGVISVKGLPTTSGEEFDDEPRALQDDVKRFFSRFGKIDRMRHKPHRRIMDIMFEDPTCATDAIRQCVHMTWPPRCTNLL